MTRKEALEAVAREARQLIPRVDALDITTMGIVRCARALEQAIAALDALPPYPPPGAVKVRAAVIMDLSGEYNARGWAYENETPDDDSVIDEARWDLSDTARHVGWLVGYFVPPEVAPELEGEEEAP